MSVSGNVSHTFPGHCSPGPLVQPKRKERHPTPPPSRQRSANRPSSAHCTPRPDQQAGAQPRGGPDPGPTGRPRVPASGRVHPRAGVGWGAGSSSLARDERGQEEWGDVRSRGGPRSRGPGQPLEPHHRAKRFAAAAANTAAAAHELSLNAANSQSRESSRRKWSEARHERAFRTTEMHTFPVSRGDPDSVSAILDKGAEMCRRIFRSFRKNSLFRDAALCTSVNRQAAKVMENAAVTPVIFF